MKKKLRNMTISFTFLLLLSMIMPVFAAEDKPIPIADFRLDYLIQGKTFCVNNSLLPEFVGLNFPYKIYVTNLSQGDESYEWFVKYPEQEYLLVDSVSNPILTLNQYGKVWIKLRINDSEATEKEYYLSTRDYSIKKEKQQIAIKAFNPRKDVSSVETTVLEKLTVLSSEPFQEELSNNLSSTATGILSSKSDRVDTCDFKISYAYENKFYTVNDGPIPITVKTPPYEVNLIKTGEESNFVWYIQLPGYEYVWMNNTQNAIAQIWRYGTTKFKLVVDGDINTAVEYSVTAYGSGEIAELKEAQLKVKNSRDKNSKDTNPPKVDFALKYINPVDNKMYDVTNSSLRDDLFEFPYKIIPVNLSQGEESYEWLLKSSDSDTYKPISQIPLVIRQYGPIDIKLRLNGDEALSSVKKIISYFSTTKE